MNIFLQYSDPADCLTFSHSSYPEVLWEYIFTSLNRQGCEKQKFSFGKILFLLERFDGKIPFLLFPNLRSLSPPDLVS
jgi:hypothetical protein